MWIAVGLPVFGEGVDVPASPLEQAKAEFLQQGDKLKERIRTGLDRAEAAARKAGNKALKLEKRPGLNHLYQHATTGMVEEYGEIEETFDKDTLELIAKWVVETTRKR